MLLRMKHIFVLQPVGSIGHWKSLGKIHIYLIEAFKKHERSNSVRVVAKVFEICSKYNETKQKTKKIFHCVHLIHCAQFTPTFSWG